MLYKKVRVVCFLSIVLSQVAVAPTFAQYFRVETVASPRVLNANGGFESTTRFDEGWNYRPIQATLLKRNWEPGIGNADRYESIGQLGQNLIRLNGQGVWGQDVLISDTSRPHVLNVQAFRQSVTGQGLGRYASAQVTYYDANHVELDSISFEIGGRDTAKNRGVGDGLRFYSWGIVVPRNATSAFISIYNSGDTETFVDAFHLFELSFTNQPGIARNLILNSQFSKLFDTTLLNPLAGQGYGVEFWESSRDWSTEFNFAFGSPSQSEWAYQFVDMLPNRAYTMMLAGGSTNQMTSSGVGVDYYDANWNRIGGQVVEIKYSAHNVAARLETPANLAHASVWVWCDQLRSGTDFGLVVQGLYLQEQSSTLNNDTSVIANSLAPTFIKSTPLGTYVGVVFSDRDGIDLAQFSSQDAYFIHSKYPNKIYPAEGLTRYQSSDRRTASVGYFANEAWEKEVNTLVIKPNRIKDLKGNYMPGKTLPGLRLPN